jgi:predicted  nucleic acid-binding Zn-ribbon protein
MSIQPNLLLQSIERMKTRIDMIRTESRHISNRIEALSDKRHALQKEKKRLKDRIVEIKTSHLDT